jgi:TonB family protein
MKRIVACTILFLLTFNALFSQTAHVKGRNLVEGIQMPASFPGYEGVIVVSVKVDQYGKVVEAVPGAEGTTLTNKALWNSARKAALEATFNKDTKAPAVQSGTITFNFGRTQTCGEVTSVREIVENGTKRERYTIRAVFEKTYNAKELLFSVEEDDYIIPVKLQKKDLGAVKRFAALNLQKGDTLVVDGYLYDIDVDYESFVGLSDAAILEVNKSSYHAPEFLPEKESNPYEDSYPFQLVEDKPSFKGGDANKFSKWVNSRLVYPSSAKELGIQGRVTVQFVVRADGRVTDVSVLRGVDPVLDAEAVRVVSMSPKWKPGKSKGRAVDVTFTFPVIFQLH